MIKATGPASAGPLISNFAASATRLRGDTGAAVFSSETVGQVRRLQKLIVTADRLYVAADDHVYAFAF